jgi:hypothetical protein
MADRLLQYGSKLNPRELELVLERIFQRNLEVIKTQRPTPLCIWGTHGLGKTQLIEGYARSKGWQFAYCAPAQFEEMGDLHGMPMLVRSDSKEYTEYAPPDWVPREEGPGILLLDDLNRADDRILRGLMQLIQNFELFSWRLPAKWQIVATANPEGGDYSITSMDDAILTRMLHLTMVFDAKAWAYWATRNGIDSRGIAFVLNYPECVTGKRTTPRTLTQFFQQIKGIVDLKAEAEYLRILGLSALDDVTVGAFLSFVNDELTQLVDPEEILDASSFGPVKKRITELTKSSTGVRRIDRLSAICTRLYLHLSSENYRVKERHQENLVAFLTEGVIPNDLRMALVQDIHKQCSAEVVSILRDKELAMLLLKSI